MASSHPMMEVLGLAPAQDATDDPEPRATDSTATALDASDDGEPLSPAEALAALDAGDVPHDEAATGTEPAVDAEADAPAGSLTDAERDELMRFRAQQAEVEVHQAEQQFLAPWQQLEQANDAFFDAEVARIERIGAERGMSQDEIDLAVYRRVELGQGFGIQRQNPRTGQMEVIGRIQTEREFLENRERAQLAFERSRTTPSALEQMTAKYTLTDEDRTALAAFANYPPAELERIAQTLHSKNQRLTSTAATVVQQARKNVAANLTNLAAPGVPGQAPKQRTVAFDHTRSSTKLLARDLGLMR